MRVWMAQAGQSRDACDILDGSFDTAALTLAVEPLALRLQSEIDSSPLPQKGGQRPRLGFPKGNPRAKDP
jgi:hypothetical protein